jgi:hypothetical protein
LGHARSLFELINAVKTVLATLVAQAGEAHGWNTEHRARLGAYRADPSLLIASVAQLTMLPDAEERRGENEK